jgi:calcineurin-like phosphoesterase family protein
MACPNHLLSYLTHATLASMQLAQLSLDKITSDMHLGHRNMRLWRGMEDHLDQDGHDQEVIDRWNSVVRPKEVVGVWGDAVMGKMADTLSLVQRLHGLKLLLPGNHDRCWHGNSKRITDAHNWPAKYEAVGFTILSDGIYNIDGIPGDVKACHFPYYGDHGSPEGSHEDRYPEWRPEDEGHWLIHGHVHEEWKQNGMQINVGLDAWGGFPTNPDAIAELIAAGPGWVDADADWGYGLRPEYLDRVS